MLALRRERVLPGVSSTVRPISHWEEQHLTACQFKKMTVSEALEKLWSIFAIQLIVERNSVRSGLCQVA